MLQLQVRFFCTSKIFYLINQFAGVVNLIKPHMVKPGACIIDVGINRITTEEGKTKLVGDVDFEGKFLTIRDNCCILRFFSK